MTPSPDVDLEGSDIPISADSIDRARVATLLPALRKSFLSSAISLTVFAALLYRFDPTGMTIWLGIRIVASIACLAALACVARSDASPDAALRSLVAVMGASGVVWGLFPLFVRPTAPEWQAVIALCLFGNQSVVTAICAPSKRVFRAALGGVTLVAAASNAFLGTRFTVVLAGMIMLGGLYSVSLVGAMHRSAIDSIRGRLTATELAITLRAQQEQLTEANATLRDLADHDSLTGLLNRRSLHASVTGDDDRLARDGWLGIIDVDDFKQVNDRHGHGAGDLVLVTLAQRWGEELPDDAVLARTGGDEFAFHVPAASIADAAALGTCLTRCLDAPIDVGHVEPLSIECSIGVTRVVAGERLSDGLRRADGALYAVKAAGGLGVSIADRVPSDDQPTAPQPLQPTP